MKKCRPFCYSNHPRAHGNVRAANHGNVNFSSSMSDTRANKLNVGISNKNIPFEIDFIKWFNRIPTERKRRNFEKKKNQEWKFKKAYLNQEEMGGGEREEGKLIRSNSRAKRENFFFRHFVSNIFPSHFCFNNSKKKKMKGKWKKIFFLNDGKMGEKTEKCVKMLKNNGFHGNRVFLYLKSLIKLVSKLFSMLICCLFISLRFSSFEFFHGQSTFF